MNRLLQSSVGLLCFLLGNIVFAQETSFVSFTHSGNDFVLFDAQDLVPILISENDEAGILRVADLLKKDFKLVTGVEPEIISDKQKTTKNKAIIIGSIEQSAIIKSLMNDNKIDVSPIRGKWESYLVQTVKSPIEGIDEALVIAGSDKRGTIYGIFELSRQMGVSPWYWWADVPVMSQDYLAVAKSVKIISKEPSVKYRGIFINDEEPALGNWVRMTFGGFNHQFYEQVFELILRLKGNFMWPAMWGKSLFDDDPLSQPLADEYGIVLSTSHHEPFVRAQSEWHKYGSGPWNYETNADTLKAFWRRGIERMGDKETLVTIGMRGDGDEPMTEGTAIALLEKIVKDQREILADATGKPASETPQVWALYKEVQEYYDKGMTVPDDVLLLLCDDNWGNIRRLPTADQLDRPGGYGIYYHFDYVGGPRSYKWLNTNQIERTWEQMHLAYEHGVDQLWVVNVGDLKPMDLPMSFFLDYAYDVEAWTAENLEDYTLFWAKQQFGDEFAEEIAGFLNRYTKYNSRRKPELLDANSYSLDQFDEWSRVTKEYQSLAKQAKSVYSQIDEAYRDAYFQLVLYPIEACANLYEMYYYHALNERFAQQNNPLTNAYADSVVAKFKKDSALTYAHHHELADGKWNFIMNQTHIGYTSWNDPKTNIMPDVKRITVDTNAKMGVAIVGAENWYPNTSEKLILPAIDVINKQTRAIRIFNQGAAPFDFKIKSKSKFLSFSKLKGSLVNQDTVYLKVDWSKAPMGTNNVDFEVIGAGGEATVSVKIINPADIGLPKGAVQSGNFIAIDPTNFCVAKATENITWTVIPNLGKTGDAITAMPSTASFFGELTTDAPHLSFDFYAFAKGEINVKMHFLPSLDYHAEGKRYGVSIDDEVPQVKEIYSDAEKKRWDDWVSDNEIVVSSKHQLDESGAHQLNYFLKDAGLVLQKITIELGEEDVSYLGPPVNYKRE